MPGAGPGLGYHSREQDTAPALGFTSQQGEDQKINEGNIGEMSAGQSWELGDGAGSTSSDGEAAGSGIRGRGRGLF